jgi:hypothetical protein
MNSCLSLLTGHQEEERFLLGRVRRKIAASNQQREKEGKQGYG